MPRAARRDCGGVVIGWLTKLVVGIALTAVVLFDGLSIGLAHLYSANNANAAATAASDTWLTTHDPNQALAAAQAVASSHDETVITASFRILPDGRVDLTLQKTVRTMLVHLIPPLRHLAIVTTAGTGKWLPS